MTPDEIRAALREYDDSTTPRTGGISWPERSARRNIRTLLAALDAAEQRLADVLATVDEAVNTANERYGDTHDRYDEGRMDALNELCDALGIDRGTEPEKPSSEITREQVERAIEHGKNTHALRMADHFGLNWSADVPEYVRDAFWRDGAGAFKALLAALTRWRDSLPETPARKVARWDVEDGYVLAPPHVLNDGKLWHMATPDQAIAWGYEIEGGPADDAGPERLKARREALGLSLAEMAHVIAKCEGEPWEAADVKACEEHTVIPGSLDAYAAALTAEEQRRAQQLPAIYTLPVISAPNAACPQYVSIVVPPQQPPTAPEVVDVPQPVVKWCGGIKGTFMPGDNVVNFDEAIDADAADVQMDVPVALVLAMAEAIRARGGQ